MTDPLIEAIGRCDPDEPLVPNDHRWYDFDPVRSSGRGLHSRISRQLRGAEAKHKYSHLVLAGHRGCGKSTELSRVQQAVLAEGYLPLYAVVNELADPNDVGFGDVLLLMLRLLDQEFRRNPRLHPLPEKTIKVVTDWFHDVTKIEEKELERAIGYTGDVGLGVDTPFVKLLFGLNVLRKSTGKQREEIKQAVEKYPEQLRQNLNLLLDDAYKIAAQAYPRGFLFILDNLDRYAPEVISDAVLKNGDLFNGIAAHTIFVLPISLLYNPPGEGVGERFDEEILPMIPVYQPGNPQTVNQPAIEALCTAIFQRVPASLFLSPNLPRRLALLSGGCPRDLLKLLKNALLEAEAQIDEQAVNRAVSRVRSEIARKLTQTDYGVLAKTYLGEPFNGDEIGRNLLYRRAVLEYNGERWMGVHPLLWETPEFKSALAAEKKARNLLV